MLIDYETQPVVPQDSRNMISLTSTSDMKCDACKRLGQTDRIKLSLSLILAPYNCRNPHEDQADKHLHGGISSMLPECKGYKYLPSAFLIHTLSYFHFNHPKTEYLAMLPLILKFHGVPLSYIHYTIP